MTRITSLLVALASVTTAGAQLLFVGLEDPALPTKTTNLNGFPNVVYTNRFAFEVNGAAARPDGKLLLCNGPFSSKLYLSTLTGPPQFVTNIAVDVHGLAYGRGKLYGFSNFANPMGIYEINPTNGAATLRVSTSSAGFRFFGLDFNPIDGLLYGYTEYGIGGLYSIDVDTGAMVKLASYPPNVNGQGRALAVGDHTVYLMATRGDDGEPCFAYDLAQGPNGTWVPFTNPYPNHHNTGGATWIPAPVHPGDLDCDNDIDFDDINPFVLALGGFIGYHAQYPNCNWFNADCNGDGLVDFDDINAFVALLSD